MNATLKRFLILLAVFIAAIIVLFKLTNHEVKDLTMDMADATLPIVYMEDSEGTLMNELHGYVSSMDTDNIEDSVAPVPEDGNLPVQIDNYGVKIKGISFEIRSKDGSSLVQKTTVGTLTEEKDSVNAGLKIENLLQDNTEYLLIMNVRLSGKTVHYYTRIQKQGTTHVSDCIKFAGSFHKLTMSKNSESELIKYMEPSLTADNTSLQTVTIHNSLSQAAWGSMKVSAVSTPVPTVKSFQEKYSVIELNYVATAKDSSGGIEYYNVTEYYKISYGTVKMYLLDFKRTVNEIFRGENTDAQDGYLNLGIRSGSVDFRSNGTGNIICFVQQGELWSYNIEEKRVTEVFSFRSLEGMDVRENYDAHDIKIIRADETGSIDFIVYGYMNRGGNEGQTGISVCHYDSTTNTVEEELFIPSDSSFETLKKKIGNLMYISNNAKFYLEAGDKVYRIDLDTKKTTVFLSGIDPAYAEPSSDGRYISWIKSGQSGKASAMYLTDMETGKTTSISAPSGEYIRPLGFLGTDCIYGLAKKSDIKAGSAKTFAMYQINIADSEGSSHKILKTYHKSGYYISSVTFPSDGSISLKRLKYKNGSYKKASSDTIVNKELQDSEKVTVSEQASSVKQKIVVLQLLDEVPSGTPVLIIPKQIKPESSTVLKLKGNLFVASGTGN